MVLLKSSGRRTLDIYKISGVKNQNQFNGWIKHYKNDYATLGITVLYNTKGQAQEDYETAALIKEELPEGR